MNLKPPKAVVNLWDKYNLEDEVRRHCMTVAEIAIGIGRKVKENGHAVDLDAVMLGALLHDIGRAETHNPFQHFIKSAEILRKEGFEEKIVRIAERHFSAGLTAEEAEKLGLPARNYLPETVEEKIVSFADNIAFGNKKGSFKHFMRRLEEIDSRSPDLRWLTEKTRERVRRMKEEIEKLSGMRF